MKDDMEDIGEEHAGRRVLCPRCGKAHFSQYQVMDAYINIRSYSDTSESEMTLLK